MNIDLVALVAIGSFITALAAIWGQINARNKPGVDRSQGNLNNAMAIKTLTETAEHLSDQIEEYRKDNESLRASILLDAKEYKKENEALAANYLSDTEALGIEIRAHAKSISELSTKLQESRNEVTRLGLEIVRLGEIIRARDEEISRLSHANT